MVVLVVVPVFVLPLLLLMAIQVRFLPYQSEALTNVHQACVTADLLILFVFTLRLDPVRWFIAMVWKRGPLERVGTVTWGLYSQAFGTRACTGPTCLEPVCGRPTFTARSRPDE